MFPVFRNTKIIFAKNQIKIFFFYFLHIQRFYLRFLKIWLKSCGLDRLFCVYVHIKDNPLQQYIVEIFK